MFGLIGILSACTVQLMSVFLVVTRKMCDYWKTKIQVGCNKPTPTLAFGRLALLRCSLRRDMCVMLFLACRACVFVVVYNCNRLLVAVVGYLLSVVVVLVIVVLFRFVSLRLKIFNITWCHLSFMVLRFVFVFPLPFLFSFLHLIYVSFHIKST